MSVYRKCQPQFDQIQEAGKKGQKVHAFLHEKMGMDSQIEGEYNHEDVNYYYSPELEYYKPDAFNQLNNTSDVYHVQDLKEYECQYYKSYFPSNNKLHCHLRRECNRLLDNFILQKKHNTGYAFMSVAYLPANSESMNSKQYALVKDTLIVHFFINPSMDIDTGYGFCGHHYLNGKVALSLSSLTNIVCSDTDCLVTLYNITFFRTQASNIPI